MQVFTAAVFSFAHGSNDVANSIGPFAAVYGVYRYGGVRSNAPVPVWVLVVGMSLDFLVWTSLFGLSGMPDGLHPALGVSRYV